MESHPTIEQMYGLKTLKAHWMIVTGVVLLFLYMSMAGARSRMLPGLDSRDKYYEFFAGGASKFYMFGVDWCPHCKTAKPEFTGLGSTKTIGGQTVEMVYVNPENEPKLAEGFAIDGYPTFYLQTAAGNKLKYNGPRTTEGFQDFLNQQLSA